MPLDVLTAYEKIQKGHTDALDKLRKQTLASNATIDKELQGMGLPAKLQCLPTAGAGAAGAVPREVVSGIEQNVLPKGGVESLRRAAAENVGLAAGCRETLDQACTAVGRN
jgi:hypothetical protein